MAMVMQGKTNVYETDLFESVINKSMDLDIQVQVSKNYRLTTSRLVFL